MGRTNTTNNDDLGLRKVSSATGFSAGDLIYETAEGIGKLPNSTVSSATFNADGELKLAGPASSPEQGFGTVVPINGGGWGQGSAACKLASGKIALAYYRFNTTNSREYTNENFDCYMRIYNEDGTIDVAETFVGGGTNGVNYRFYGNYSSPVMNICQLSGGNIVVNWCGGNSTGGWPCWAVHNGTTGAQITAPQSDATNQNVRNNMKLLALTNGNFVIAYVANNALQVWHGLYNSTGTAISALSNIGVTMSNANARNSMALCDRHDGNYVLTQQNASSGLQAYVFDGTDKSQVATSDYNSYQAWGCAMCRDSNNDIFIYFSGSGFVRRIDILSSANTLSLPTTPEILTNAMLTAYGAGAGSINNSGFANIAVHNIEGTTKHILWVEISRGLDRMMYFNSDGTSAAETQLVGGAAQNGWNRQKAWVELTNDIRFYTCSSDADPNGRPETVPTGLFYYTINKSALNTGGGSGVSGSLGSVTANTGNYAQASSTIKNAKFFAASSGTTAATNVRTTGGASSVIQKQQVGSSSVPHYGYDVEPRIGGGFYVLTSNNSGVIECRIYDKDYALVSTTTIGQGSHAISTLSYACYITQLGNGKVVIAFADNAASQGTNRVVFTIYSSDLQTVLAEPVVSGRSVYYGTSYTFQIQGLMNEDGDEFCMGYINSSNYSGELAFFEVLADNTINNITTNSMGASYLGSYNSRNFMLCGMPNGDVCTQYQTDGYNANFYDIHRRRVDGSGWTQNEIHSVTSLNYPGNYLRSWKSWSGVSGTAQFPYATNGGELEMRQYNIVDRKRGTTYRCGTSSYNYNYSWGGGMTTANGNANFLMDMDTGKANIYVYSPKINDSDNTLANQYNDVRRNPNNNDRLWNSICMPTKGNEVAIFGCTGNSNFDLSFQVIRIFNEITNIGYDTSSSSAAITLDDPSNRADFLGVAVTDCPAGGSGTIQTKGDAKISSSYADATTAENFNFESRSTNGRSGLQNGRSVTLRE